MKWSKPIEKLLIGAVSAGLGAIAAYLLTPDPTWRGALAAGITGVLLALKNIVQHVND